MGLGLLSLGTPASLCAADWVDVRREGPVVCYAEFSWQQHPWVFQELGSLHAELVRVLGVPSVKRPIEVYCYRNKQTYWAGVQRQWPDVPYRRALYVQAKGASQVFAFDQDELAIDLRHEVTHALLNEAVGTLPLWLDEGLAEYFEMEASQRANGHPSLALVQKWLALGTHRFSFVRLEGKQQLDEMQGDDYREAWAWVHFMLHGPPEAQRELVAYLRDVGQQRSDIQPLGRRLAQRFPDLQQRFVRHFSRTR